MSEIRCRPRYGPFMIKSYVRKLIPRGALERFRRYRRLRDERRNAGKSVGDVFTTIYRRNKWGGRMDELCSVAGSSDDRVVSSYVSGVSEQASRESVSGLTFVDLGCGDFSVGGRLLPLCSNYVGVDIVEPVTRQNREKHGDVTTCFEQLNIVQDSLPRGDVCFIRQVFQHLSNGQISAILGKLDRYRWSFSTEHYPSDNDRITPNLDKVHGSGIRLYDNSGVYLTEPPFRVPARALELVLEVVGTSLGEGVDADVIRTFRQSIRGLT
jgi:hypothetical protein